MDESKRLNAVQIIENFGYVSVIKYRGSLLYQLDSGMVACDSMISYTQDYKGYDLWAGGGLYIFRKTGFSASKIPRLIFYAVPVTSIKSLKQTISVIEGYWKLSGVFTKIPLILFNKYSKY